MDIVENAGYKRTFVKNIYKKCLNQFNHIQSAQKEKRKFTTSVPFNKYTSMKLKNKAVKLGIHIPIKPNKSIYQRIRDDRDNIKPLETAGIYRIKYRREGKETGAYIGKTKRKIKERIAEHRRDINIKQRNHSFSKIKQKRKKLNRFYTYRKAIKL